MRKEGRKQKGEKEGEKQETESPGPVFIPYGSVSSSTGTYSGEKRTKTSRREFALCNLMVHSSCRACGRESRSLALPMDGLSKAELCAEQNRGHPGQSPGSQVPLSHHYT